jgi:hypothetical protein
LGSSSSSSSSSGGGGKGVARLVQRPSNENTLNSHVLAAARSTTARDRGRNAARKRNKNFKK